jgi:DNA processing protein
VIGGGLDKPYPPENIDLHGVMAREGLLVAEMPMGTEPQARHFRRNRIIAGLCAGTVVVEAAPGSGSLITARLAGEVGREVMAIPGSPLDARAWLQPVDPRRGDPRQTPSDVIELIESFTGTRARLSASRPTACPGLCAAHR